jgi:hypothetical protein
MKSARLNTRMQRLTAKQRSWAGSALTLLVALATTPNAAAQNSPSDTNSVDEWRALNAEAAKGDAVRQREADRLYEEERSRRDGERVNKLRQALDKNQAALDQPRQLLAQLFELPATLTLSADHRALAEATLQVQRTHAAAVWPAWQQQVSASISAKAGNPSRDLEQVALQLSTRVLNEAALWFADATPHASDAVWIEALQHEGLCQGLTGTAPAAQMAALIEELPAERRATAWAGEAARLSRWGQEARTLLPPPERTLEDSLVPALAPATQAKTLLRMPAALRTALHAPGWKLATQAPAQRCELLRWWSQEQVRQQRLSPRQALLAWRTALAPRSADHLLTAQPRSGAQALDKTGFPLVAASLGLSGKVVVEQDVDASGKVLHAFVQRRELRSASLGKQTPLALEHELDQATLDRVAATPPAAPDPAALREGVVTRRVGIEWVMN